MSTQIYMHKPTSVEIASTPSEPGFILRITSAYTHFGLFVDKQFLLDLDSAIRTTLLDLEGPTE